ncbi:MAG: hypothetical protein RBS68_15575 [Anaerolineales bacterium]|jgi:hypothetical protein|nr:hypothetical protein [Anaerolineales bacterium]
MAYYLGYTHELRQREIFCSALAPTRATHGSRYKSYRGPMSEVAAHYIKYREENDYPELPTGTTAADLEALAEADQDFYWQALRVALTIPDEELAWLQQDEALEYNPDFSPVM